ncbi:MAG: hypothetical protein ACE5JF_08745 [Anaerolineales bacterium]
MRTPAGSECKYYFEDFARGRNRQECRLIDASPNGGTWTPDLCEKCPVPRISMANACPNLVLDAKVKSGILGLGRGVNISSSCLHTKGPVEIPEVGCGHCHEFLDFYIRDE